MYSRPTLAEIVARTSADMAQRMQADEPLRRADAAVYARVFGGAVHGAYGYLDWLAKQLLPDTAEEAELQRWARLFGVDPLAATKAVLPLTFTVQTGAVVPIGAVVQALDGVQYETLDSPVVVGASAVCNGRAVVAGAAGNRAAGDAVTLIQPLPGVQTVAQAGEATGGADAEGVDALRARLLARMRNPPQAGCKTDYEGWALAVPSVTRAWCVPLVMGAGTVGVRFVCDGNGPGAAAIPSAGVVAAVDAYIQARRPVTARVFVAAPVAAPLNLSVRLSPDTLAIRAAVITELQDLLTREASPGGVVLLSHLRAAISGAAGEVDHELVAPTPDVHHAAAELAVLGVVTWL